MLEDCVRGGILHAIQRYIAANIKYIKRHNNDNESLHTMYIDVNNLYGWTMSQKLPVNGVEWEENMSRVSENFIKYYN